MRTNRISVQRHHSRVFIVKAFLVWVLFIPVAFINGFVRELLYKPVVGELLAHQISCILASLVFFVLAYFMLRQQIHKVNYRLLWIVGGIWLFMTILFEFGLGQVNSTSWERLFNDYNFFKGRLWGVVLLTIFLAPVLIRKMGGYHALHKNIEPVSY